MPAPSTNARCGSTRPASAPTIPPSPSMSTIWGWWPQDQGDLPAAQRAFSSAPWGSTRQAYGPDHPNVAIRCQQSRALLRKPRATCPPPDAVARTRACHFDEKSLGPDHPNVAIAVNNLGECCAGPGRPARRPRLSSNAPFIYEAMPRSRPSQRRALMSTIWDGPAQPRAICPPPKRLRARPRSTRQAYGPDHPNVAIDVNNLGMRRADQGDLPAARALLDARCGSEQTLGDDHPNTRTARNNLASLPAAARVAATPASAHGAAAGVAGRGSAGGAGSARSDAARGRALRRRERFHQYEKRSRQRARRLDTASPMKSQ